MASPCLVLSRPESTLTIKQFLTRRPQAGRRRGDEIDPLAGDVVEAYARMMLDGQLDPQARASMIEFMNRNEKNEPALFSPNPGMVNSKVRGMLHLMMSMPEYQLC